MPYSGPVRRRDAAGGRLRLSPATVTFAEAAYVRTGDRLERHQELMEAWSVSPANTAANRV